MINDTDMLKNSIEIGVSLLDDETVFKPFKNDNKKKVVYVQKKLELDDMGFTTEQS